jgi:hypothetical protein
VFALGIAACGSPAGGPADIDSGYGGNGSNDGNDTGGGILSSAKAITVFTLGGVSGKIIGTDIRVKGVSLYVDATLRNFKSLTPDGITHTSASVSPGVDAARDFTKPVTYTVTAQDGTTATYTVRVTQAPLPGDTDIGDYLTAASGLYDGTPGDPIPLPVAINLADPGWADLLSAIQSAGKYVALDLSACTPAAAEFDPGAANPGEKWIVSLVLPDGATGVKAGDYDDTKPFDVTDTRAFRYFKALTRVAGAGITDIGANAFRHCKTLTTASFPAVKTIGERAFNGCEALTAADFPAAETIGEYAFINCDALITADFPAAAAIGEAAFRHCDVLSTVDLPKAATIGESAFQYCDALTTVSLPEAETIGGYAFQNCTSLTTVILPAVTAIGNNAFYNNIALTAVSLPEAETIGDDAFYKCTALTMVDLPKAETIGAYAFESTGAQALAVYLSILPLI